MPAKPAPLRLEAEGRTLVVSAEPGGVRVGIEGMVLLSRTLYWVQAKNLSGWLSTAIAWKEGTE